MPYILKKYYPLRNIIFFLGEGFLIFSSLSLVFLFLVDPDEYYNAFSLFAVRAFLVTAVFQLFLYYFDLYDLSDIPSFSETFTRITQAFGFGCITLGFLYYFFPLIIISTKIFWIGYLAICMIIASWRFFYTIVLDRRMFTIPIAILGTGELAQNLTEAIENKRDSGYKIKAFLGSAPPRYNPNNVPFYPNDAELNAICCDNNIEKLVVALDDKRKSMPIADLMACKLRGVQILKGISLYEELTGKILVENINPSWIIFSQGFRLSRFHHAAKRATDILISFIGLVLSSPVSLLSAIIIKLESPGPIFYLQERVGAHGRIIKVIKFRSMRSDAEKNGPVWAMQNDDRVTRYGKFIRKVRIDEIPQMWNVLKGEMSFVGPRPERPVFVKELEKKIPYYSLRHNVKPGITGWAQIFYPYGASEEDALHKLEYDLYYIKNFTLSMDLWILFQTVKTILFGKGAR